MKGFSGSMSELIRQANQMQTKMKKVQEELAKQTFEGSSGGGAIKVTVTGEYLVKSVTIDPEFLKTPDTEMLQDMILTAVNEAIKNAKETSQKEMQKITGGLAIPGLI
ncbi:MAG: YbaB/EbfC family nucleoid-associated protein [Bdellovibrionaceae bacterium]|nr:YbaB/EbfC family nucleoid-associated protein [Pseudobdellovibrionaceae bacterium]MDW8189703.1 YbaB/EbfC family nucleoid-associated protein [Pseudobdellovibrionaceae bacterium]